jgi:hypothetical protein
LKPPKLVSRGRTPRFDTIPSQAQA